VDGSRPRLERAARKEAIFPVQTGKADIFKVGNVTIDNLEDEDSTRNARLMRMMEDMHVVENRGSGIRAMLHAMREANLEPPRFDDRRTSFTITLHNQTLMTPEAIQWLNRFAQLPINDHQRLALVYLKQNHDIDNQDYRRLNRVDMMTAGHDLRGMVKADLVEQTGVGRWTKYRLKHACPDVAHTYLTASISRMFPRTLV
jgi:ATP-dependent DNA helicase RecG